MFVDVNSKGAHSNLVAEHRLDFGLGGMQHINVSLLLSRLGLAMPLALFACSFPGTEGSECSLSGICLAGLECVDNRCVGANGVDRGPADGGLSDDSGVSSDSGVRSVCPEPGNFSNQSPECIGASDCAQDLAPLSSECAGCRMYNNAICQLGRCTYPELLGPAEGVVVVLSIVGFENSVRSLAGIAVASETSGGLNISCSDVYSMDWGLDQRCYNWIDSRFRTYSGGEPAQAVSFRFGRFPGGRDVLLIVYGFQQDNADGLPIGVSCTEVTIPFAGTRTEDIQITGDSMQNLP